MNKKIGVMLDFKANTTSAKSSLQSLQTQLSQISNTPLSVNSASIRSAAQSAAELQAHLAAATNVDTGKLDLTRLGMSLQKSNATLSQLTSNIISIGPAGQQSFVLLAQSMAQAEAPAIRLNNLVQRLWTTFGNTLRYQISASVIMGFVSAIQEAYQYTQDLNESLNNIRIVTDYSVEKMTKFAEQANKAAKALSTTTTEYTNASLIYFQQGLSEKEVIERTNITIKMANVTGQAVETVSDQLTAVWNNFDDGTKSLEYYVDVITALGAATASSSEEITEGLEKFAAVAETVGLSYEYATSALATVTATTRQSADVVGTAFKTLFARIQSLELGETLDDGTTLGEYSQALMAAGINIKDVNGSLKDMDVILEEMGAKWGSLNSAQKVALAQNVAGIRQYTQLIALMDNWDYFQENLNTAINSTGSLQKQSDIYAEGWMAARDKVTAALEDIYDNIFKDSFFIDLSNTFAKIIDGIDNFMDSVGGIGPIIQGLAGIILMSISGKIQPALTSLRASFLSLTTTGALKLATQQTQELSSVIYNELVQSGRAYNIQQETELKNSVSLLEAKNKLWAVEKQLTASEKLVADTKLRGIQSIQQETESIAAQIVQIQKLIGTQDQLATRKGIASVVKTARAEQGQEVQERVDSAKNKFTERKGQFEKASNLEKRIQTQKELLDLETKGTKTYEQKKIHLRELVQEQQRFLNGITMESGATATVASLGKSVGGLHTAYEKAKQAADQFEQESTQAVTSQIAIVEALVASYNNAAAAASHAGEASTDAFLNGNTQITLGQENAQSLMSSALSEQTKGLSNRSQGGAVAQAKMEIESLRTALNELGISIDQNLEQAFNDAASSSTSSGKKVHAAIEAITQALGDVAISSDEAARILNKMGAGNTISKTNEQLKQQQELYKQLKKRMLEVKQAVADFNVSHRRGALEMMSNFGGALMSVSMLTSSVQSLTDAFKDGFDPAEDFATVTMSLAMIIPIVAQALKGISGALISMSVGSAAAAASVKLFHAAIHNENAALAINALLKDDIGDEERQLNMEKLKSALVSSGLATAETAEATATQVLAGAKQNELKATRLQTIADSLNAKAKGGSTVARVLLTAAEKLGIVTTNASTGAVTANAAAWYAHPVMWIAIIIIAVIAALAALAKVLWDNSEASYYHATAMEKATAAVETHAAAVESAAERYKTATERLEQMRTALLDIATTNDTFAQLIEGSTAWRENLEQSNQQIEALLQMYPQLENLYANGEKVIDFTNGIYTVANMGAVQQFVEGSAKVAQNINLLTTAFAKDQLRLAEANKTYLEEVGKARIDSLEYDYIRNDRKDIERISVSLGSATIEGKYNQRYITGNSSYTLSDYLSVAKEEIVALLGQGKTVSEAIDEITEHFPDLTEEMKAFLYEGLTSMEDISAAQNKLIEARSQELELIRQAATILSSYKGYEDLTSSDKELASRMAATRLENAYNRINFTEASKTADITDDDVKQLAEAYGIDWKKRNVTWQADEIDADGNKVHTVDYGDFFSTSNISDEIISAYARSQGIDYTPGTASYSYDKVTFGAGDSQEEILYQDIINYAKSTLAMQAANLGTLLPTLDAYGNTLKQIVTENTLLLTEEEISHFKDQLATGELSGEIHDLAEALGISSEELMANIEEQLNLYNAELAKIAQLEQDIAAGKAIIATEAEKWDLDTAALEAYASELQEVYGTYEAAAKAAVLNARYTKGVEALTQTLEDSIDVLQQWSKTGKTTYKTSEAVASVIQSLQDALGVKVSTNFVQDNLELIERLTIGGQEAVKALEELEVLAAKDYVTSLNLTEESETKFHGLLDYLSSLESGISIDAEINLHDEGFLKPLQDMVKNGEATVEEIQAAFEGIGWSPVFETKTETLPPTTSYTWSATATGGSGVTDMDSLAWSSGEWQKIQTTQEVTTFGLNEAATVKYTGGRSKSTVSAAGGGSSKKSKKEQRSGEKERYHELKETLSDLERQYDKIAEAKDRAWGPDKLAYMKQERAILQEQIKVQQDLVDAMKADVEKDWSALDKYGASRDSSGRITNYDELFAANMDLTDDEWDEFIAAVEQYEATLNGLEDEQETLLNLNTEFNDSYMEEIQQSVDYTVEKIDNMFTVLEHQISSLNDPIYEAADAIALLGKQAELSFDKIKAYQEGIVNTLKQSNFTDSEISALLGGDMSALDGKTLTAEQIGALTSYQESLWTANEEIEKLGDAIHEKVITAVEEMNEGFAEQSSIINHNKSILNTYKDIIDLVGKDTLGISDDVIQRLNRVNTESTKQQLQIAKSQLDTNKALYADTLAEYNAIKDTVSGEEKKRWEETLKNLQEQLTTAEEGFMTAWSDSLTAAAEEFDTAIDSAITTFKDGMAGLAGTSDALAQSYAQHQEISSLYLQDYEKIYNLSKLNREINKSLDETDSLTAKNKLRDIQEEINSLQESGVKLTQYELDELQAKYELRLAEIALEEAQNAKSQVRMRRDSEGNWGYVYTADETAVSDAEQNYEDKLYKYQDLTQDYITSVESALIEIPVQMAEAIAAVDRKAYESESEYLAAIEEVRNHYHQLYTHHLEQMNLALGNSAAVYEDDWAAYSEKTGYKISIDSEWRESFNETFYSQKTGYSDVTKALTAFSDNTGVLLDTIKTSYTNWRKDVDDILNTAETDVENFGQVVETEMSNVQQENEDAAQSAEDMAQEFTTAYQTILQEASKWTTQYTTKFSNVISTNEKIAESIGKVLNGYKSIVETAPKVTEAFDAVNRAATSGASSGEEADEKVTSNNWTTNIRYYGGSAKMYEINGQLYKRSDIVTNDSSKAVIGEDGLVKNINTDYLNTLQAVESVAYKPLWTKKSLDSTQLYANNATIRIPKSVLQDKWRIDANPADKVTFIYDGIIYTDQISHIGQAINRKTKMEQQMECGEMDSYDTGGYTGSWDSSGRLAMLHQKEIVLNARDTENFLAAVNIVRDVASMIDLKAAAQTAALSAFTAMYTTPTSQTIEQSVTIHAEFPNATNHSEIEEAFSTLINRAAQFANQKN